MGTKTRHLALLLLVSTSLLARPAIANEILHPFDVQIDPADLVENPDGSIRGKLTLIAGVEATIESLDLQSPGWLVEIFDRSRAGHLTPGERWSLPFAALPTSEDRPLVLRVSSDRGVEELTVGLSPASRRRLRTRPMFVPTDRGVDRHASADQLARSRRVVQALEEQLPPRTNPTLHKGTPRPLQITGTLVYDRVDGLRLGCYGAKVDVYDDDTIGKTFLGTTFCDYDGNFTIDTVFNSTVFDRDPDVLVEVNFDGAVVKIRPNGALSASYGWRLGLWQNYPNATLDLGTMRPPTAEDHPIFHIANSITQAWSTLFNEGQGLLPQVTVVYPDNVWPHYDSVFERIHLPRDYDEFPADPTNDLQDFQWRERTHIHEFGHHVIHKWGSKGHIDYCNDMCDTPDCGHCLWCSESPEIAWSEGWANWFADYVESLYLDTAGYLPYNVFDFEESPSCGTAPEVTTVPPICPCSGDDTEGFFTTLLHDIVDPVDTDGTDPFDWLMRWSKYGEDRTALGSAPIWAASFGTGVQTPWEFINRFLADQGGATLDLWSTFALNNYQLDVQRPGVVGSLTSTTHSIGVPSSNSLVTFTWTPAPDDLSGIDHYSIRWGPYPAMPETLISKDLDASVLSWTSPPSAPGDWYFSIVAIDRSSRTSGNYASFGPITIVAPTPANVTSIQPSGWSNPLVPRPAADATPGAVPAPVVLSPYPAQSWLNVALVNAGQTTAPQLDAAVFVDDIQATTVSSLGILPGNSYLWTNTDPILAPPGRHTLWMHVDPNNQIFESDETDNLYGQPWVWQPPTLGRDATAPSFGRPGLATAGWESYPGPIFFTVYNVDGFRMTSFDGFHAASLRAIDPTVDYDLRLYTPATSATNGFYLYDAWSTRPAGELDVVLTNSGAGGVRDYDLGVVNLTAPATAGGYELKTYGSGTAAIGDSVTVAVAQNEFLLLRQFAVSAADTGNVSIDVLGDPALGPWHLSVFFPSTVSADLSAADADTLTDGSGRCRLELHLSQVGTYGFLLHRNPRDAIGATALTYEIQRTPPDLAATTPPNWYASVVLRDGTGSFTTIPAPASPLPTTRAIYVYGATTNLSPNSAPSSITSVDVDGVRVLDTVVPAVLPGETPLTQLGTYTSSGGRHTFVVRRDGPAAIEELNEINNIEAEQFVFAPNPLGRTPVTTSTPPPDPTAGREYIPVGHWSFYNCEGWGPVTPDALGSDTGWVLGAVVPSTGEDVNLQAHRSASSGIHGFEQVLISSSWQEGMTDFVLLRPDSLANGKVDFGVFAVQATHGYTVSAVGDSLLPFSSGGGLQLFEGLRLPPAHAAKLFALEMRSGSYAAELLPVNRRSDLGLSVFVLDGTTWRFTRDGGPGDHSSWTAPPDQSELVNFDVGPPGLALVVVWKVGAADLPQDEEFVLRIGDASTTDTPPTSDLPTSLQITRIHPNPFNPRVEIHYDLAQDGRARVEVFDLRGKRVAVLEDRILSRGNHRVAWTGVDAEGRPVGSGVYFVRLSGPSGTRTAKMVLAR